VSLKQFSAYYAPLEDRIVLHLNTTEGELYSFLVTRAITKSLSLHAQSAVEQSVAAEHTERSSKIIVEFQKEGLKKQLSFEDSFEGGSQAPLGTEPLLITQVTMEIEGESVAIALTLMTNQILRFTLLAVQVQAFTLLLERLAQQADWKLHEPSISLDEEPATENSQPASQLH
jgi:hypothetical protein